jgi:thioredoxin reductase (NADPH)
MSNDHTPQHELVIIGAGPAALSAAIYTTREDIETVLYERGVIGGLAAVTDIIDNYPGFSKGVTGLELADSLRDQAERFGAKIELGEVKSITDEGAFKRLVTDSGELLARAVLIATGSDYMRTGIPGEEKYYARGVHFCATCDGAFYRDKKLVVIGGGNSAIQETLFLTRFASHIDILVRSTLKASDVLIKEMQPFIDSAKITLHIGVTPKEIVGDENGVNKVVGINKDSKEEDFNCDGVFVFIGLKPNTAFLKSSKVELDERGFVITNQDLETAMPGVFAAGDVRSGATMQIASASGEGATAALKIREYLEGRGREIKSAPLSVTS